MLVLVDGHKSSSTVGVFNMCSVSVWQTQNGFSVCAGEEERHWGSGSVLLVSTVGPRLVGAGVNVDKRLLILESR